MPVNTGYLYSADPPAAAWKDSWLASQPPSTSATGYAPTFISGYDWSKNCRLCPKQQSHFTCVHKRWVLYILPSCCKFLNTLFATLIMSFSDLPERVPSVKYPVVSQPISHPGLPLASGQGPVDPKIAQGYYGPGPLDPAPKSNNKILGLRPAIFWIIIVLLVVILAGALGGGLGGGLAAHSHSSR